MVNILILLIGCAPPAKQLQTSLIIPKEEVVVSSPTIEVEDIQSPPEEKIEVQISTFSLVTPKIEIKKEVKRKVKIEDKKPKSSTSFPKVHIVEEGETLPKIAEKYYNNPKKWIIIYEANKDKIEKGILEKGQVLIIP